MGGSRTQKQDKEDREEGEKMLQQLLLKCVKRRRRQGKANKKAARNKGIKSNEQEVGRGEEGQK